MIKPNIKRLETAVLRRQAGVPPLKVVVRVEDLRLLLEAYKEIQRVFKREGLKL